MDVNKIFNKNTLIVAAIIVVAGLVYLNFNTQAKLISTRYELETANTLYDMVAKENARLDSMRTFYIDVITRRDTLVARKEREIVKKDLELSKLRKRLNNALEDVTKVTADSSYNYINLRVPKTSEQTYPFDSLQVKNIHYTYIERDGLHEINDTLSIYVGDLKQLSSIKDTQIVDLKSLNNVYIDKLKLCESNTEAVQTENEGLKKDVKREKQLKTVSNVGVLGLIVALIAIIL